MTDREQLRELRGSIERLRHLSDIAASLREQKAELSQRIADLQAAWRAEEADVEQLERVSFVGLFYSIIGQKVERLDKERREAYAAHMKLRAAQQELEAVEARLSEVCAEMAPLSNCQNRYEVLLRQYRDRVRASDTEAGERLRALEEELAVLEQKQRNILEAISAGERAMSLVDDVLRQLEEARSLGRWDMFGGGMLVNLEKHEHLDSAQGQLTLLQEQLRRFRNEALDVDLTVCADVHVNIQGFDRFADVFLDNIFHDLNIQDSIEHSLSQVNSIRDRIAPILHALRDMQTVNDRARQDADRQLQDHLTDVGL